MNGLSFEEKTKCGNVLILCNKRVHNRSDTCTGSVSFRLALPVTMDYKGGPYWHVIRFLDHPLLPSDTPPDVPKIIKHGRFLLLLLCTRDFLPFPLSLGRYQR
jgi:hypothetical protein